MATDSWVIRGTLDMLILKLLSIEPTHGWGLAERIQRLSGDTLRAQQGSLYASLHRLTREGWIRSWWEDTENGRRARFYDLTKAGARQLEIESDQWRRLATGVARIMAVTA
jgi:PadR family transcriptional regulator PadR